MRIDDIHREHQIAFVNVVRCGIARFGLGAEGDSYARSLDHRDVVGAVSHGDGVAHGEIEFRGPGLQRFELAVFRDDLGGELTCQRAVCNLESVGKAIIDPGGFNDAVGNFMEAPAHYADFPTAVVRSAYKLERPRGKRHAIESPIEDARIKSG